MTSTHVWFHWALLSAAFASLTAIFAKIGLEGVDSDFATLIRTVIILLAIIGFVPYTGKWSDPFALRPRKDGLGILLVAVGVVVLGLKR